MEMPKVSIIIPTLGRRTLYPLVSMLIRQRTDFPYEIVLIPQVAIDEDRLKDKGQPKDRGARTTLEIHYEPLGKGFAYYRNVGISKSTGGILAFIDDDEIPRNTKWLSTLVSPIMAGEGKVTTAGVRIKLGQGYLTDSISLLGFPGGGRCWFQDNVESEQ